MAVELVRGGSVVVTEGASTGTVSLAGGGLSVEGAYVQGIASTGRWLKQLRSLACELGTKRIAFENVSFLNYTLRNELMKRLNVAMKVIGEGPFGLIYQIILPTGGL